MPCVPCGHSIVYLMSPMLSLGLTDTNAPLLVSVVVLWFCLLLPSTSSLAVVGLFSGVPLIEGLVSYETVVNRGKGGSEKEE